MFTDRSKTAKSVLLCLFLLFAANVVTNYRFFYRFFYRGPELIYEGSACRIDDHYWQVEDIGQNAGVIELTYHEQPYYLSVSYTNDEFKNYGHFNPAYETDRTQRNYMFIYSAISGPVDDLLIFAGNGSLDKIILNPRVPWQLNGTKTLAYWLCAATLIYIFSDRRPLGAGKSQTVKSALLAVLLFAMSWNMAKDYSDPEGMDDLYCRYYTDALIQHRLDLDYPVPAEMKSADPYDTSDRDYDVLWDATYYEGKYYSYFGILPAAAVLAPYKMMTGNYLSGMHGTLLYLAGCFAAGLLLLKELVQKYMKNTPYNLFALSYLYIIFGSKLIWSAHRPLFYEMLACAAWFHAVLGLYLVLFSKNRVRTVIGCTALALTALCRPTFLLASVFLIPYALRRIREKDFGIADFLCMFIPYAVIGLITMYLNYVRFGSPTEFGLSYQLTANSMLKSRFSFLKALVGTFMYMFEGFTVRQFPLAVSGSEGTFPIVGDFFMENAGGGFVVTSVLGILIPFLLCYVRNRELKKGLYICIALAVFLLLISNGVGALVGRYMVDFSWLLYFVITAEFLCLIQEEPGTAAVKIFACAASVSVVLNYLLALSNI